MDQAEQTRLAAIYRRFAADEAVGRSPLYQALCEGIAADPQILALLGALPRHKQQPNLLLAAFRHCRGTPSDWADFRRAVLADWDAVRAVMLGRSTQTNEPGRCAALVPVLARLPQPLALIEVGASAGLCLLLDRYGYDYGGTVLLPPGGGGRAPVFPCAVDLRAPLPAALPQIVWRAGLDLKPLDIADAGEAGWLETLVWPEQTDRLARLRAAMAIAATDRPCLVAGDLRRDLAPLAAEAPKDATLVVFHTAVLAYVTPAAERLAFAHAVEGLCDFWLANEAPAVFPEIASRAGLAPAPGRFLIAVNGSPVAWADAHGRSLDWIADPPPAYPARRRTQA